MAWEKISALEKIGISNDELHRKIEEMVRPAKDRAVSLREFYRRDDARENLRLQMVFERTLDFLLERAKVLGCDLALSRAEFNRDLFKILLGLRKESN